MKALLNNFRVSLYACLLVALAGTVCLVYIPKGIKADVDQLQQSVQTKRLSVQNLLKTPKKNEFSIPKEAQEWLNMVPYDPQVDRMLLQLQDLLQQSDISVDSITVQDKESDSNKNSQANGNAGQAQNQSNGKQPSNQENTLSKNLQVSLSVHGSYANMTKFFYNMYLAPRLLHVDSLSISHKDSSQSTALSNQSRSGVQTMQQALGQLGIVNGLANQAANQTNNQTGNMQIPNIQIPNIPMIIPGSIINSLGGILSNNTGSKGANANLGNNPANNATNPALAQFNNILKNTPPKELQDMTNLLAAFLAAQQQAGTGTAQSPNQLSNQLSNQPFVASSSSAQIAYDSVSVTLTLSMFYIPGANFLGTLPNIQTYPPSGRTNLVTP